MHVLIFIRRGMDIRHVYLVQFLAPRYAMCTATQALNQTLMASKGRFDPQHASCVPKNGNDYVMSPTHCSLSGRMGDVTDA